MIEAQGNKGRQLTKECLEFIEKSPSCFHAAANLAELLEEQGFERLDEKTEWKIEKGGSYYVMRNSSSILAFRIPGKEPAGFHMMAAHSDSPCFKLKPDAELSGEGQYVRLNTEKYGGMILSTWFDRALSVAGRVITGENGKLKEHLVMVDRDLVVIPNLAIHMSRDMNKGVEYNPQVDLLPLFGGKEAKDAFLKMIAKEIGCKTESILGSDLYLYVRQKGSFLGAKEEFIVSPRLDDLQCAFVTMKALAKSEPGDYVTVGAVFDNEEVGSQTRQGAASTFLKDTLENIAEALGKQGSAYRRMIADSFLISADNAHARHPNRGEKADPVNAPYLNGGVVIKHHGGQKYMTDAGSEAYFKQLCREAEAPYQDYTNRSDIPGGSTLGNIVTAKVSVAGVDVGLPQLAMHSAVETAGSDDMEYLYRVALAYYTK
ncbi:MAG: M18 family aminopeptidase [Clostridiales bacterium]|nr:M18 family aminopeptidase [Clostridiales bacterium]